MQMIEIAALDNGAHNNQTYHGFLPNGWALIPVDPETLENYPFGSFDVKDVEGVPYMVAESWQAGEMPAPEPIPETEATDTEVLNILLGVDE